MIEPAQLTESTQLIQLAESTRLIEWIRLIESIQSVELIRLIKSTPLAELSRRADSFTQLIESMQLLETSTGFDSAGETLDPSPFKYRPPNIGPPDHHHPGTAPIRKTSVLLTCCVSSPRPVRSAELRNVLADGTKGKALAIIGTEGPTVVEKRGIVVEGGDNIRRAILEGCRISVGDFERWGIWRLDASAVLCLKYEAPHGAEWSRQQLAE